MRSRSPFGREGNGTETAGGLSSTFSAPAEDRLDPSVFAMSPRYSTLIRGVTRNALGQEVPFIESSTVRLVSDQEAFVVLQNSPMPGSLVLLETTLLEEGDQLVQARIRGRVIRRDGAEWQLSISPRSRLYSVPRSTFKDPG